MKDSKIPPQAVDVEKTLLGELIQFPDSIDDVVTLLSPDDFYKPIHVTIFKSIYDLWSEGKKIDLMVVTSRLKKEGKLDEVGGAFALTQLGSDVMHSASVKEHALIVKEASVKRQFIMYAGEVGNSAFDNASDIDTLLNISNSGLDKITDGIFKAGDTVSFKSIIDSTVKDYYLRKEKAASGEYTGIKTPLFELSKITGGWQPGDLIILASRPSMGKTAFAVQCAVTAARLGSTVDVYTLEMTAQQLTQRMFGCLVDLNIEKLRNGTLSEQEEKLMEQSINKMLVLNINLDDKSGITASYVKAKSSANHRKGRCDMIIVDYLQLMSYDTKLNSNEGYGSISRSLKGLAKDLNVPVILVSQLNRSLEQRGNKRPTMADLRSSGEIEQDADMIIFPYREYYYSAQPDNKGKIEFLVSKNRNGRIGTIDAFHNDTITQFYDEQTESTPDIPF
jgi:replicative DNA helicase